MDPVLQDIKVVLNTFKLCLAGPINEIRFQILTITCYLSMCMSGSII